MSEKNIKDNYMEKMENIFQNMIKYNPDDDNSKAKGSESGLGNVFQNMIKYIPENDGGGGGTTKKIPNPTQPLQKDEADMLIQMSKHMNSKKFEEIMARVVADVKSLRNSEPKSEKERLMNRICSHHSTGKINRQFHELVRLGEMYEADEDFVMALAIYENAFGIASYYIKSPIEIVSICISKLRVLSILKWTEMMKYTLIAATVCHGTIEKTYKHRSKKIQNVKKNLSEFEDKIDERMIEWNKKISKKEKPQRITLPDDIIKIKIAFENAKQTYVTAKATIVFEKKWINMKRTELQGYKKIADEMSIKFPRSVEEAEIGKILEDLKRKNPGHKTDPALLDYLKMSAVRNWKYRNYKGTIKPIPIRKPKEAKQLGSHYHDKNVYVVDDAKMGGRKTIANKDFKVGDTMFTEKPVVAYHSRHFCTECGTYMDGKVQQVPDKDKDKGKVKGKEKGKKKEETTAKEKKEEGAKVTVGVMKKNCTQCKESFCSISCFKKSWDRHHSFECNTFRMQLKYLRENVSEQSLGDTGKTPQMFVRFLGLSVCHPKNPISPFDIEPISNLFIGDPNKWYQYNDGTMKLEEIKMQNNELFHLYKTYIMLSGFGTDISRYPYFNLETYFNFVSLFMKNSMNIHRIIGEEKGKTRRETGQSVVILNRTHLINHSCVPNAYISPTKSGPLQVSIKAYKKIKKGEEITIAYCNIKCGIAARRKNLEQYGFICECQRCKYELKILAKIRGISDARNKVKVKDEEDEKEGETEINNGDEVVKSNDDQKKKDDDGK